MNFCAICIIKTGNYSEKDEFDEDTMQAGLKLASPTWAPHNGCEHIQRLDEWHYRVIENLKE